MSLSRFGINFDLKNVTPLNFSVPSTKEEWASAIPETANRLTNNLYGLFASATMFVFLFWYISDLSPFGDFRYSRIRTIAISSCIVSILGSMMLYLGFFNEFFHVAIFVVITMIFTLWVAKEEQ